ncbi:MAG: hypothetical protein KTR29_15345, partial [Rhodothermaceae bacterium]|nr:hypothetical protein [Rhodothermaceae bacterium]
AEAIINALFPGDDEESVSTRNKYVTSIHKAIMADSMKKMEDRVGLFGGDVKELYGVLDGIKKEMDGEKKGNAEKKKNKTHKSKEGQKYNEDLKEQLEKLQGIFANSIKPDQLLDQFQRNYEIEKKIEDKYAFKLGSRTLQIIGRMLAGTTSKNKTEVSGDSQKKKLVQIATGIGIGSAHLLEVAFTDNSWQSIVFKRATILFSVLALINLIVGVTFGIDHATSTAWVLAAIILVLHVVVRSFKGYVSSKKSAFTKAVLVVVGVLVIVTFALGVIAIVSFVRGLTLGF